MILKGMQKMSKEVKNLVILFSLIIIIMISGFSYAIYKVNEDIRTDYTDKMVLLNKNLIESLTDARQDLSEKMDDINTNLSVKLALVNSKLTSYRNENKKEINTLNNLIEQIEKQSDIKLNELKEEVSNIKVQSEDFTEIIDDVLVSVVSIATDEGIGSGAIIDSEGFIVTNYHVVEDANYMRVLTYSGKAYNAILIGYEPIIDVAVLKIEEEGLSELEYDDSDDLRVGEKVIALGNPAGLSFTVTEGIVSSVHRVGANNLKIYIQTDVSINPGNSGGPLVNTKGKIIGINNYKISGFEGLGFAIESNSVKEATDALIEGYLRQEG